MVLWLRAIQKDVSQVIDQLDRQDVGDVCAV